jgi:hypothetical protein
MRLVAQVLPGLWVQVRFMAIVTLSIVTGIGFWTRRLSLEVTTAAALILFACLLLTGGSMDRMNMALTPALLLVGLSLRRWTALLVGTFWFIGMVALLHGGLVSLHARGFLRRAPWNDTELSDALLVAVVVAIFFAGVVWQVLKQPGPARTDAVSA